MWINSEYVDSKHPCLHRLHVMFRGLQFAEKERLGPSHFRICRVPASCSEVPSSLLVFLDTGKTFKTHRHPTNHFTYLAKIARTPPVPWPLRNVFMLPR